LRGVTVPSARDMRFDTSRLPLFHPVQQAGSHKREPKLSVQRPNPSGQLAVPGPLSGERSGAGGRPE